MTVIVTLLKEDILPKFALILQTLRPKRAGMLKNVQNLKRKHQQVSPLHVVILHLQSPKLVVVRHLLKEQPIFLLLPHFLLLDLSSEEFEIIKFNL